jgi:hypothetical protein
MNQSDSTLIRITRALKFHLEQLGLRWQLAYQNGRMDVPHNPDGERVSLDAVIRELLKRDESHRERSKCDSKSRAARLAAEADDMESKGKLPS